MGNNTSYSIFRLVFMSLRYASLFKFMLIGLVPGVLLACGPAEIPADTQLDVSASSTLSPPGRYAASNLVDGTPRSWCEGAGDDGVGVSIQLRFTDYSGARARPLSLNRLYIQNGFGIKEHYSRNNRVKTLLASSGTVSTRLELKDTSDPQVLNFPDPLNGESIELRIESIYPGEKDNDTCIAELALTEFKLSTNTVSISQAQSVSILIHGNGLTLKKDGTVSGTMCVTCQTQSELISGQWLKSGDKVIIDLISYSPDEEDCDGDDEFSPCVPAEESTQIVLTELTRERVVAQDGATGQVIEWEE